MLNNSTFRFPVPKLPQPEIIFFFLATTSGIFSLSLARLVIYRLDLHSQGSQNNFLLPNQIIYQPTSIESHLRLAKNLLKANDPGRALEEIKIAQNLGASNGQIASISSQAQNLLSLNRALLADRRRWRQTVATRPAYRDGWYQLAVLSWILGDDQEAEAAIIQALELDPTFGPAGKLLKKIQDQQRIKRSHL